MKGFLQSKTTKVAALAIIAAIAQAVQAGNFDWKHLLVITVAALGATIRDAIKSQTDTLVNSAWANLAGPAADPKQPIEGEA